MRPLLAAARKDSIRRLRDPAALLLWLGVPFLIGAALIAALGGQSGPLPKIKLLVANQDDTIAGRLLIGMFQQGQLGQMISLEEVDREAGQALLDDDQASALLVIPAGFGQAVLEEKATRLELMTNPRERIKPQILEEILSMLVDLIFYAHRLLGDSTRDLEGEFADGNATEEAISSVSVAIHQRISKIAKLVFPPTLEFRTEVPREDSTGSGSSMALLFLPSILIMAIVFVGQGISEEIWSEREQGTLHRFIVTPSAMSCFLGGKLISAAVVVIVISVLALLAGMIAFEIPLERLPLAAIWCGITAALCFLVFAGLQVIASSRRAAFVLTNALMFPLLMLGGSFFPTEVMPPWMAQLARFSPNGHCLHQLKGILFASVDLHELAIGFCAILVSGVLLFAFTARRLAGGFARG